VSAGFGYVEAVSGGYENGNILTFRSGEQIFFDDEHPVEIKISENWKDEFDGYKEPDYLVMVEVYRPGKGPFGMFWKCRIQRSRLQTKPELVRKTIGGK
jgi:hypothetical protein